MRRVTISDVAKRAGVSRKTVSRVVNREANVSATLRTRVQKVVDQLNYVPDRQARSLRSGKSFHIAFIYESPSSYFVISLVEGIRTVCKQHGYVLIPHETDAQGSQLVLGVLEFAERERLDGLLMMPPMTDNDQLLTALDRDDIVYGRIAPGTVRPGSIDVSTNDREAARKMADYVLHLGHKRIAYISGHPDHLAMAARLDGVRESVANADSDCELSVHRGLNTFESGLAAAREILAQSPRPTAVFAANDDMAAGVLFEARELGLRIPEDLSVAGYDDTILAARIWPGLTTVHQPIHRMGERAAENLLDRVSERPVDAAPPLSAELVKRRSTGRAPDTDGGSA